MKEQVESILKNYPGSGTDNLIPILQEIQARQGYLSEDSLVMVGRYLSIPTSRIFGVATFYNQFRLTPLGENVIKVCRGTACHVSNSANILYAIETELNVKAGQTTRDKKFTLETVACIGACSIAPVIAVNDEYHGRLTVKEIPGILKKYNKQKPVKQTSKAVI